jgi:hypothetical protein
MEKSTRIMCGGIDILLPRVSQLLGAFVSIMKKWTSSSMVSNNRRK